MDVRTLLGLVAVVACGGGGNNVPHDAGDAGCDPSAGSDTMVVRVLDVNALDFGTAELLPFAGVTVGVDLPGGAHRDVTTGSDGGAVVDGIAFACGTASVIATVPGFSIAGAVNLSPDTFAKLPQIGSGDVTLRLFEQDGSDAPFELSGGFTLGSASDSVSLGIDPGDEIEIAPSTGYQLDAPGGAPLTIVAADLAGSDSVPLRWAEFSEPAITSDTTLDLDLGSGGTTLIATDTHVTLFRPTSGALSTFAPSFELTTTAFSLPLCQVTVGGPGSGAGELDFTTNCVSVAGFEPMSLENISGNNGALSRQIDAGSDALADRTITIVNPPDAPTGATAASIAVGSPPDGAVVSLLAQTDDQRSVRIDAPPGTTSIALPTFPATDATPTTWQLGYFEGFLDDAREFHLSQVSETFELQ